MNSFFALLSFNTDAGGPGTIDASFRAAESDSPLVVVEDSGKAADLLAFAWHILHDDEKWLVTYTCALDDLYCSSTAWCSNRN